MLIKYTKLVIKINKSNDAPLYKEFRKQNKIMIVTAGIYPPLKLEKSNGAN